MHATTRNVAKWQSTFVSWPFRGDASLHSAQYLIFIKNNCHKNYLLRLLFFFMNGITINRIAEKIKIRINDVIAS